MFGSLGRSDAERFYHFRYLKTRFTNEIILAYDPALPVCSGNVGKGYDLSPRSAAAPIDEEGMQLLHYEGRTVNAVFFYKFIGTCLKI